MKGQKTKKELEKDGYGMTKEDYKKQYVFNLKRIGLSMGIVLGIPYLLDKSGGK